MADAPVVVVGGGLAGLAAALSAVEAGASSVTLLEKEGKLGGNSVKASFGINAVGEDDTVEAFVEDVYAAGGQRADRALVTALAERSLESLSWLKTLGLPLDEVVQGAGSRAPRVRKVLGFQLVLSLSRRLEELANEGKVSILKGAKVVELVTGAVGVHGVKYEKDGVQSEALGAVVLSSGGSAAEPTLLPEDLRALPGTQGSFTQGEGQRLAVIAGASLVDSDKFQIHPTAFVDPNDKEAKSRILASEWLRQAGGVLIDGAGGRFCNECADTARDIAGKLAGRALPIRLVLPPKTVEAEGKHLGFYKSKGLLAEHANPAALAQALGLVEADLAAALGEPFAGGPLMCGEVAQAVHYSLGGVRIDSSSRAMGDAGPVPGLFAAGEVTGGIHGLNRLAGNGLLESVVFGRSAGRAAVELGLAP